MNSRDDYLKHRDEVWHSMGGNGHYPEDRNNSSDDDDRSRHARRSKGQTIENRDSIFKICMRSLFKGDEEEDEEQNL